MLSEAGGDYLSWHNDDRIGRKREMRDTVVQMRGVSWLREKSYILSGIDWNVEAGEHWAIVGLNGSGKTTLLNMVTGYIFPSEGEVTVLGKKFGTYDLRELRKSIGWVSSSLMERLMTNEKVEDIILSGKFGSIGLYEHPSGTLRQRAADLMEQFGCMNLASRVYSTLSQGEKQKVLIARALMSSPRILILDEPCTGLDILARESLLTLIEEIGTAKNAPTLLYVSHHVEEILPVFTRTVLLRKGRIHSSGNSDGVLSRSNLTDFFERPVEIAWRKSRPWIHLLD